jgi:signal transduction histidine kinase
MQAESDLIRTNQMQFKDEFLSHGSHELRSSLTAIYQFVTILLDKLAGELNQAQREYLEIVFRNLKQLHLMINDLLEVTRMQAGKLQIDPQQTSISDAIIYAVNILQVAATAKSIKLTSDIKRGLPPACGDPRRIRQILIILLDNAIKFTPTNGSVKVKAGVSEEDTNLLLLEVSDTECGISSEMTERIFERLFQTADPALGRPQRPGAGVVHLQGVGNETGRPNLGQERSCERQTKNARRNHASPIPGLRGSRLVAARIVSWR